MEEKLDLLIKELRENTEINRQLLELLKDNNNKTDKIHKYVEAELTVGSQAKVFGLNILANLAANTIQTPQIIKL